MIAAISRFFLISLTTLTIWPAPAPAAQTAEELLDEINRLPTEQRQARLVAGAKKEGSVVWYVAMNRKYAQEIIDAFEAEYPFIKVQPMTGGSDAHLTRILAEYRSRAYRYDVLNTRVMTINTLKKARALMRYRTPYRKFLRPGFYDEEGYFNGIFATPQVFLFNTKLIDPKEAPQSIEDLTDPKWKGKLGIHSESYDWLAALMDHYGEEKGQAIAKRIGDHNLQVRRGASLLSGLVAAGEIPIQIDAYHQEAILKKKEGAPVAYTFPTPFVPVKSLVPIYMAAHPPHPHAAALIADFLLGKKGQTIMQGHGRWVSHKTFGNLGPDDIGDRPTVTPSPDKWGDNYKDLVKRFNRLLLHQP